MSSKQNNFLVVAVVLVSLVLPFSVIHYMTWVHRAAVEMGVDDKSPSVAAFLAVTLTLASLAGIVAAIINWANNREDND